MPLTTRKRRLLTLAAAAGAALPLAALAPFGPGVASAASFGTPVVVSGDDASEPGIDVAPDGTLYVNAPVGVLSSVPGSPSNVYRSDNGGTSWTRLPASLKANLPGGGDSDIAISPNGTLSETDLWLRSAPGGNSRGKGETRE